MKAQSKEAKKEEMEWQAKNDLRIIHDALKIIRDEERMKRVRELARKNKEELEKIEDPQYFASIGLAKK